VAKALGEGANTLGKLAEENTSFDHSSIVCDTALRFNIQGAENFARPNCLVARL